MLLDHDVSFIDNCVSPDVIAKFGRKKQYRERFLDGDLNKV